MPRKKRTLPLVVKETAILKRQTSLTGPPTLLERRRDAATTRRLRPTGPAHFEGLSVLEASSVLPSTAKDYANRLAEFNEFLRQAGSSWSSEEELDVLITEFFDMKYWEGAPSGDGSKFLAAVAFAMPRFSKRLQLALPRACRSMKGWVKLAPPEQRLPCPMVVLCCILAWFLRRQMVAHAVCLYLQFLTYLRPGGVPPLPGEHGV